MPESIQLGRDELEIDPEVARQIAKREEARRAQYAAEMAWTLEKHTIAHEKLRKRFYDRVTEPVFCVKCIKSNEVVSTFRLVEPSVQMIKQSSGMTLNALSKMKSLGNRCVS